jgi:hypothetical protein
MAAANPDFWHPKTSAMPKPAAKPKAAAPKSGM